MNAARHATPAAPSLTERARALLIKAMTCYRDDPRTAGWLRERLERLDEPLRLAVCGRVKSGKSTLINALIGESLAPTDTGERTQVNTVYRYGPEPAIRVHTPNGAIQDIPVNTLDAATIRDLQHWRPDDVARLVIESPSPGLQAVTLIETPGVASAVTKETGRSALTQVLTEADAMLYLTRHTHQTDVQFLQSAHEQQIARMAPINTILVLSRADEMGSGSLDAMNSADRIAQRYRDDPKVRSFAQHVVPVSGLIGHTSHTLTREEFTALARLASMPLPEFDSLLLSADRFISRDISVDVPIDWRRVLLARLGRYGVSRSVALIRSGVHDHKQLALRLLDDSRLSNLQDSVHQQFIERQEALSARSVLMAVDIALRAQPRPDAQAVRMELERTLANAHEFVELRVLSALRSGQLQFPPPLREEAERLLGAYGTDAHSKLGQPPHAAENVLAEAATTVLARWRAEGANPLHDKEHREAARVVLRSCERVIAHHVLGTAY